MFLQEYNVDHSALPLRYSYGSWISINEHADAIFVYSNVVIGGLTVTTIVAMRSLPTGPSLQATGATHRF